MTLRLADLQRQFREAVLERQSRPALDAAIDANGFDPAQRLQIYRNHTYFSLTEAVAASFPVVRALVGPDFFATAARHFIMAHPPTQPSIALYGDRFPDFLADYPAALGLPYLPDIARLEWDIDRRRRTLQPRQTLPPQKLGSLPPEHMAAVRFHFNQTLTFYRWRYPIAAIWRLHQPGNDPETSIDLDQGPSFGMLVSQNQLVALYDLDAAALTFIEALQAGKALGQAADAAITQNPGFDLTAALHLLLTCGGISDFDITGDNAPDGAE